MEETIDRIKISIKVLLLELNSACSKSRSSPRGDEQFVNKDDKKEIISES